jgi:hypothetical protein
MRRNIAVLLLACLSACTSAAPQPATLTQVLTVACVVDGVLVPIAQPVVASLGQGGATASNVDSLLVHPAVIAACKGLNGSPASVAPAGPPVADPAAAANH